MLLLNPFKKIELLLNIKIQLKKYLKKIKLCSYTLWCNRSNNSSSFICLVVTTSWLSWLILFISVGVSWFKCSIWWYSLYSTVIIIGWSFRWRMCFVTTVLLWFGIFLIPTSAGTTRNTIFTWTTSWICTTFWCGSCWRFNWCFIWIKMTIENFN